MNEQEWTVSEDVRRRYLRLFEGFLARKVDADAFASTFLDMWRQDRDSGITTGRVVDQVMTGVDCYEPEPDPTSDFDIDEAQLRIEVGAAVERLTADAEQEG